MHGVNRQRHPSAFFSQGPHFQGCKDSACTQVPRPSAPCRLVRRMVLSLCVSKGTQMASSVVGMETMSEEVSAGRLA